MKRKITPILAALAVILSALASTAMAVETFTYDAKGNLTHIKGIPVEPIPTVEQARAATEKRIAEIKAEEAKQAAQAAHAANIAHPPSSIEHLFFTGKPYLEETGQYLFLFRHYDPELARWTTADPSGFPDGANEYIYAPKRGIEIDFLGLQAKTVIDNLTDALEHWSSNAGGSVPASDSVDAEIKAYSSYATRKAQLENIWQTLLPGVSRSLNAGTIARPGTTWGLSGPIIPKTVGSVDLSFPPYSINLNWAAGGWSGNKRLISGTGALSFSYNDEFNFVFDPNNLKTIFTDVIPSWFAGEGTPFYITGSFSDTFSAQAWQYE